MKPLSFQVSRMTGSPKRVTAFVLIVLLVLAGISVSSVVGLMFRQQIKVMRHKWEIVPRSAVPFSVPPMQDGVLGAPVERTSIVAFGGGIVEVGGAIVDGGLPGAPVLVVMLPWDRQHRNWRYPRQEESVHLQLGVPTRTPGGIVLTMPGSADVTMAMTVGQYRAWVDADPGLQELAKVMHQQAIARGWVADLRTNPDPAIWLVAPPPPAIEN